MHTGRYIFQVKFQLNDESNLLFKSKQSFKLKKDFFFITEIIIVGRNTLNYDKPFLLPFYRFNSSSMFQMFHKEFIEYLSFYLLPAILSITS